MKKVIFKHRGDAGQGIVNQRFASAHSSTRSRVASRGLRSAFKTVSILLLFLILGVGSAWGAKDDVVYKINTASTKIATSTTYANYGPSTCASAQAGSTVSSASWCVTCGSAQTEGLWLGANNNQKAKMTLGNGSFTEASAIATAIGVETTDTYYAAMICRTNLSKVYKVTLTYSTPGGTAPGEAWILYSTDNGSTWSVGKKVTSLSTSGTDFEFASTVTSAARYAFVIHSTGYCQFKKPVLTFYEGTTGGTTYTVTYNLNGGGGTTPTESAKSSGATFSLHNGTTGITPPSGKVFSQWKDQDNNYYNGGATYTMPAKDVTLTAQWVNTYTVTYNLNGGTGTTPTEGAHPSGATFTLHDGTTGITAPTKKEFSKWRDQDGTDYNGGVTYTMPAKAVTLTAQWVAAGGDYVLVEDAEDIGPGKYLIVYNNAKALNTHYGNVNANTYATYTDISSYYSNKKIAANATTNALAYTVAETANGYSISHIESGTTYYLGNSSNSTGAYLRWDNPFTASTDEWTLGVNSIVSTRNSNYAIRWNNNSGSYRFAIYNPTGQQAVQLFKQVEACEEAELAYSPATETKTYGDAAFTKTLTNSHSVAVTYALSDVSPAGCVSINTSTGQVTINGAGSATVTASSAKQTVSDVDYCADEVSYTLTVNKANISPTLTYSPNSVTVGENSATPTVGGNTGSGTVTYAITSATPAGCATINTSTGVVTGVATGSVTITATIAATTNYNGNTATATVTITAASNFPNNRTIFIQAHSTSAWTGGGCVKAWFHSYGGSETAQSTYWLFDAGSPDEGKKLFAAIVPSTGNLPYLDIQRFAANCSDWWNKNGGCSYSDADGSNVIRSTGKHDDSSEGDYVRWNDDAVTLSLYGDPNSWASSLASFSDQGNGVWTATYDNYAPANAAGESQDFKICTNYNGWIGHTGSNSDVTVDDMHVGSTYNIGATLDIKDHSLTMSKTFVKGTVHFDLQGHGSAISDLTNVAAGSKISAPGTPSATGYDFGGWYKEPACTNQWNFGSDVVNETMTLYAKWTKHNYTISSTLNHCSSSPSIPSSYEYTGSAAGLTYTISADAGYRLPTSVTVSGVSYTWDSGTGALVLTGTISSNVTITITAVQTHTVTWLSNGSNHISPATYDHGAALVLPGTDPTAPSSCSEKVFIGWTAHSEITSETSDAPELISAGGAVNEDATYRAVFADEEGGGTKWVQIHVTTGMSLGDFSAGKYMLVTPDGHAFNGTISSGKGGVTANAFDWSAGEATSAPTGADTIIFAEVKSGDDIVGYSMYSIANSKYLYADAATSGHFNKTGTDPAPTNYWTYAGSNWRYNKNYSGNYANLRTYSNNTFNTYSASNNGDLYLAKLTGGISYDNYITLCCSLKPVTGLAVSSSTANSVTLSWTAPSPTTGIDHLELRNASTDAKIGSNIAVGTTTTSVSGLVECNTYSYKIVSVGASCETSSEAIEAQPFSGAKTVTFNYNGGSGSPASFTTSCAGNTVALPTPDTRTGYTFQGWWTASSGGIKKGDAGAIYTVTGTTTLWAHWSETNYTVTMAQSPAAGAELTGGTTTAHYGGTINISTDVPAGYRFTGWTASPSVTFADASATSTSFTMPNSNVTVTANFVQIHTLTFIVPTGGGSAVTPPTTADHGGTVTLPSTSGKLAEYSCETFLGWTTTAPNGSGTWASTPTYKAVGATSDAINSNTVFYAVYSRSGGGASGTVELTGANIGTWYTSHTELIENGNIAYGKSRSITVGDYTWTTNGYQQGAQTSDYYLSLRERTHANGVSWIQIPTMPGDINTITFSVTNGGSAATTNVLYLQSGTTSGETVIASSENTSSLTRTIEVTGSHTSGYITANGTIKVRSITVSYGPAPIISHTLKCGCVVEEFDLTYNANTSYFPGSIVNTTACTAVDDWNFEDDGDYTICATEPTCEGYKFTGWTTSANGSGDHYDAGDEISCISSATTTLYAQYERVYTVTFNNQGATTPVTQGSYGAAIDVPSATTPCSGEWAFVGWSETAIAPMSLLPTLEITAGTSTYTPTDDKTLYAIYRKTSTSSAFVAGMSGAYKISNGSTVYAGACNNSKLPETNAAGAYVFYIKYTSADGGKYTIQQADGKYLKYGGSSTSLALDDETPYYWTMTKNGDLWHVLGVGSGRYLQHSSGTGFKAYDGNTTTDIAFVAADGQYYYRTMSCAADYDITFHANGTTITWAVGHPEASYKDLANATVVSTFPTATYDGWTFLGWRRSDYAESTTVPEASGIFGGSDGTSGNTLTIASADEDLYPVFTKFEDNAPFDQINGGDYYIYFLESGSDDGYGGEKRVYATDYDDLKRYSSTALCAEATEFTFTKLANGNWTIYDKAKGKYLYAEGDDWLKQKTTTSGAEWTLTVNGNAFDAYCVGTSFGQISAYGNGTSALFMNYARTNIGSQPNYHRVYLGGCSNRTFTTNPSNTPEIVINGKVKVTSAASQAVKSTTTLSVSAINISTANLTVTSDNSAFTFSLTQNGSYTSSVNIPVVSNKVSVTPIYVAYTPSATTDGIENATVTVSDGAGTPTSVSTESGDVQGRHLPAQFVIAAKAGSEWVALTAKISKMGTQDAIPIQVDNTTTPTKASVAMNTSEYSLLGLPSTNSRYATNGIAVHLYSNQTSKVLNATKSTSIKTAINTGANASNAASSDSCLFYEWKLFSEDLVHYTVTNSNTLGGLSNNRVLGYSTGAGKWGMYTAANANQDIFLLPIETLLTDLDVEVMEWSTTGMALRFNGTAPSSIKVTLGGATSAAKSLTNLNSSDIYTVSGLSLSTNNCAVMQITDGSDASKGTLVRKPILVSGDSLSSRQRTYLTDDVCASCDIVILNNGKLTADQAKTNHTKFANIYVYPGGKLVVDAGSGTSGSLGANQKVYVRGGYSWLNPTTYKLPELYIQGNINFEGSGSIIYDYYIQPYKYYQCALPYNSELAKITDEAGVDDFPSWLKHYDGSLRAANAQATSWDWYNGDEVDEKTVIPAGKGFIIAARPRQVAKVMNRPLAIIRFPLINNAFNGSGEAEKTVSTTAHGIAGYNAGTVTANNVGWNLIGNPYMATWKGNIGHSQLEKHPDAAHWDGSYYWKDGDTKYVTVMSAENGSSYEQYVASTTELKPFFPFFIQETASGGTGTVTFTLGNRVKKAPAYLRAESENREAFVQIDMTNGENQDQTGIYVGNKYSDDLDFDDLEKMFGSQTTTPRVWIMHESTRMAFEAMSEERAAGAVPMGYRAPETGEYTFTLSDYSNLENVEAVLLDDNEAGVYNYNLLTSDYTFSSESALYNDTRFVIRIEMKNENQGTTTGTENIDLRSEEPFKFIYHDKMYILRNGVIYDATGKKVREINK